MELLVARAGRPQGELLDTVAREARVRVTVDQAWDGAEAAAVDFDHVAARRLQVSHLARLHDVAAVAQDEGTLDDPHVAERRSAQGGVRASRRRELRQVANKQPADAADARGRL